MCLRVGSPSTNSKSNQGEGEKPTKHTDIPFERIRPKAMKRSLTLAFIAAFLLLAGFVVLKLTVVRRAKQGASCQVKGLMFQNLASGNYRVLQSC